MALEIALAQDRERFRIAAGLHDDVGALLSMAVAKLEQLQPGIGGDQQALGLEIRNLIDRALSHTRTLTFELGSPILHDIGLVAATEALCQQLSKESGIHFRVSCERELVELERDQRSFLYQAIQELCRNVVKHSRAPRAEVCLHADAGRVWILVRDDGEGFDSARKPLRVGPAGGFGLFAINEMSGHFRGRLQVESNPGKGTEVALSVPIH